MPHAHTTADPAARKREEAVLAERMARIGRKILVLSGKGGVGKSTVAANLAVALAKAGKRVGLLDVDLHGPSIPGLLGLTGERLRSDGGEGLVPVRHGPNLHVLSIGFMLKNETDALIWRGPLKYSAIRQFLKDALWGELDVLVIDAPPGTGDEPLAVAQMVGENAAALIVTTPQNVAVADVRRSASFCTSVGLPVAGIVENMSGMVCPHCSRHIELFKAGGGAMLARETGAPLLAQIPIDPAVAASGDRGRPFAGDDADHPAARAFTTMTRRLIQG